MVSAGAPVHPANIEQFAGALSETAEIHTPYGASEAVPVISIGSREILSETRKMTEQGFGNCVGRPLSNVTVRLIKIMDTPIEEVTEDLLMPPGEPGEIIVQGDHVTAAYHNRPLDNKMAKIPDGDGFWHRMGDLAWMDHQGRFWFLGRKSHRVTTPQGTLFTIPCEAIFNNHPDVARSALVGVGKPNNQIPVICVEIQKRKGINKKELRNELLDLAESHKLTRHIQDILFHDKFPVDIRHNSKIFREKLAVWAAKRIKDQ